MCCAGESLQLILTTLTLPGTVLNIAVLHSTSLASMSCTVTHANKMFADTHILTEWKKRVWGPYFEGGCRPHQFAIVQDEGSSDGIILVVNEEVLLVAGEGPHGQQELGQVVAVQGAGLGGQPAW